VVVGSMGRGGGGGGRGGGGGGVANSGLPLKNQIRLENPELRCPGRKKKCPQLNKNRVVVFDNKTNI